ncbi:MAG: GntR family transcriptional regulator [Prolixibacteraceae bacterium]|jgi:DNA-binding transcriptional regulator YhcF (GntR family)|nr:GntR family transcriptional regulator [Prolixibacteraceae bacterium]MDI9565130.1 GntR family transcriptional regulator [Bacteroidota bacterium]HNU77292.1 GntR family transcriptional regulator [Prolixibacteraceae bacterium]HOF56387.1 GntR family transcriptional regulator [Prolixibacteraceae bacterium]HOS00898.1 GntR family transcriptional regulator [Prolixibacteraceae bacterium]
MNRTKIPAKQEDGSTKIRTLVNYLTEAMGSGTFAEGGQLPSLNEVSRQTGFSRDTVAKAYAILKARDLIESVPAKGFFVKGQTRRIFMLLDDFSSFKEQLYQAFRENLPDLWTVDLLFHHYNEEIFDQLVRNAAGRYNMYVVMNISNRKLHPVLKEIDPARLLILDMGSGERPETNYLLQDFDEAVEICLEGGIDRIKKYRQVILVWSARKTPHPPETISAVRRFCRMHDLGFKLIPEADEKMIQPGHLYFVIRESDLVKVVKACQDRQLVPGQDVGILAYNDTPMKEIAGNGITVISVDFREMGKKAAGFVTTRQRIREFLPSSLLIRQSL